MLRFQSSDRFVFLAVAVIVGSLASMSWATSIYDVTIGTTGLSGTAGQLAFDLINGDGAANNTVTISSLATDGTLPDASDAIIDDLLFFNEVLRGITFGTALSFTVTLTENFTGVGVPDAFSFFLVDTGPFFPPPIISTTDPTGAEALFAVDINGMPFGDAMVFSSTTPGVSWSVTAIPEPATLMLFATGLLLLIAVRQYRCRRHRLL